MISDDWLHYCPTCDLGAPATERSDGRYDVRLLKWRGRDPAECPTCWAYRNTHQGRQRPQALVNRQPERNHQKFVAQVERSIIDLFRGR